MNKIIYSQTKNQCDSFYKADEALLSAKELNELNKVCHPVWFFVAECGELISLDINQAFEAGKLGNLKNQIMDQQNHDSILKISTFIKKSFFDAHSAHYEAKDLEYFREQQKLYFENKTRSIIHYYNNEIFAVLTLCHIAQHHYLKESVWHTVTFPLKTGQVDTSFLMGYKAWKRIKKMAKSKFTAEQISNILKEAAPRGSTPAVARKYGISDKTIINWRQRFKGVPSKDIQNLKTLEAENNRLKRIVANMAMDIEVLKEVNAKKW